MMSALERQCCRCGVGLIMMDPAWTTRIPREYRFQDRVAASASPEDSTVTAAFVIGRSGLGIVERMRNRASPLVCADKDQRGTRGWSSAFLQWLPDVWRRVGGRRFSNGPGAP